jgi:hypothetical protein
LKREEEIMNKNGKKLSLRKETVRNLGASELGQVNGRALAPLTFGVCVTANCMTLGQYCSPSNNCMTLGQFCRTAGCGLTFGCIG